MVSAMFTEKPSQLLKKDLESNTGVLQQLLQDFSSTANAQEFRLQIKCFYELRETRKPGFKDFVSLEKIAR